MRSSVAIGTTIGDMTLAEDGATDAANLDQVLDETISQYDTGAGSQNISQHQDQASNSRLDFTRIPLIVTQKASEQLKVLPRCWVCRQEGDPSLLCVCPGCNSRAFHKTCWPKHQNHLPTEWFPTCDPPTDFTEYIWIQYLLHSNATIEEQRTLHRKDIWSMWFGVPHQQERPKLYVYPVLDLLIENACSARFVTTLKEQFPSLVSFFGDTGGGKSTIIRALIRNAAQNDTDSAPIPGNNANRHKSTSGDVHLYADPASIGKEVPLFYADCEGLRGAGVSTATRVAESEVEGDEDPGTAPIGRPSPHELSAIKAEVEAHRETVRNMLDLQWGRMMPQPGALGEMVVSHETRKAIVKDLYPRFLYTFTDVVCYTTTNSKATEAELVELFEWASKGHEWTRNQRVRPGLVIIVNKDVPSSEQAWLDVEYATKRLLAHLELSTAFAELREKWRLRGTTLRTAEDLILCYYDSFRIVCIPTLTPETTHTIAVQYNKLYQEIQNTSERMRKKKLKLGMKLNVEKFSKYMQDALRRMAKDLTSWIDFHYMAIKYTERPVTFSEHVAALLAKLREHREQESKGGNVQEAEIVSRLTPFVACAIASSIPKSSRKETRDERINLFLEQCRSALERFRDTSWKCEAKSGAQRCVNYYVGHEKGHQFATTSNTFAWDHRHESLTSVHAASLLVGEFECSFESGKVIEGLFREVSRLIKRNDDVEVATTLVAKASGVTSISSNRTCFPCLSQCPVYILPCEEGVGHTICEKCAIRFSERGQQTQSSVKLQRCPLGCYFKHGREWQMRVKPRAAGVRLLALDGGGVRGIMELVMLRRIESEVGFDIPIQELFDLAIGTSTGGIVALSLFKMNWKISSAILEFEILSKEAFSKRYWLKVPVFRHTAQLLYSHRYMNDGIESALRKSFGSGKLFGSTEGAGIENVKVGVVASAPGDHRPYLLANYSRNATEGFDSLVREDDPMDDLLTWEAARSTSAAPTYFEPYHHGATDRTYIDGALRRNNPCQTLLEEKKAIWDPKTPVDIILSLGTGLETDIEGKKQTKDTLRKIIRKIVPKSLQEKVAVGINMIQSTLDCDQRWEEFVSQQSPEIKNVCHRLNIGLEARPPNLDDVDSIQRLRGEAENYLARDGENYRSRGTYMNSNYQSAQAHLHAIARRLLAGLFYFESKFRQDGGIVHGDLFCRLNPGSKDSLKQLVNAGLSFRVQHHDKARGKPSARIEVTFDLETLQGPISFKIVAENPIIQMSMPKWSSWESISGFATTWQ